MGTNLNPEMVGQIDVGAIDPANPTQAEATYLAQIVPHAVQVLATFAMIRAVDCGNAGAAMKVLGSPIAVFAEMLNGHPAQQAIRSVPGNLALSATDIPVQVRRPADAQTQPELPLPLSDQRQAALAMVAAPSTAERAAPVPAIDRPGEAGPVTNPDAAVLPFSGPQVPRFGDA